jgi:hypothetical protein
MMGYFLQMYNVVMMEFMMKIYKLFLGFVSFYFYIFIFALIMIIFIYYSIGNFNIKIS